MAREEEYVFDNEHKKKSKLAGLGKFIWNSRTKEFCGRDGASWAKVSLFYAIFYTCLGSFFVGMIAVFMQIMPWDRPTYIGEDSVMAMRGLNPGLGFRPQIDVEDSMIKYNPSIVDEKDLGYKKQVSNLKNFLDAKYGAQKDSIKCEDGQNYQSEFMNGKACKFDHNEIFKGTECTYENNFGYTTPRGCIMIKLNKIVTWKPEVNGTAPGVLIKCEGEFSADKDNVNGVTYHSENYLNNKDHGVISSKYFPFNAQKDYQAPFVWVQFDLKANTLVNILCKAEANNIDNTDKLNRRGQTKFSLYVRN